MSIASRTGQVTFLLRSGVYSTALMCNMGDLYQVYDGEPDNPSNITPDFPTLQPTYQFIVSSSRVAEGVIVPSSVKWYFNDVELTFAGNVSTNSFAGETGHFKSIPYQAGTNDYYGLQIVKNLVKASEGASCTIKAVGTVTVGSTSDSVQYLVSIPITKGVGNSRKVTIVAGDNNYFAIREKGGTCILKATMRQGASEVTSGLTYRWYQLSSGVWSVLSSQVAQTLQVNGDMVSNSSVFKVEVLQNGILAGYDVQEVVDLSDPLDIITNPNPANETIESGSGDSVTYSPILVKRGSTQKYRDMTFYFTFMDAAGNILNPSTSGTAAATGTCTEAMCAQAGGNVSYTIETAQ